MLALVNSSYGLRGGKSPATLLLCSFVLGGETCRVWQRPVRCPLWLQTGAPGCSVTDMKLQQEGSRTGGAWRLWCQILSASYPFQMWPCSCRKGQSRRLGRTLVVTQRTATRASQRGRTSVNPQSVCLRGFDWWFLETIVIENLLWKISIYIFTWKKKLAHPHINMNISPHQTWNNTKMLQLQ